MATVCAPLVGPLISRPRPAELELGQWHSSDIYQRSATFLQLFSHDLPMYRVVASETFGRAPGYDQSARFAMASDARNVGRSSTRSIRGSADETVLSRQAALCPSASVQALKDAYDSSYTVRQGHLPLQPSRLMLRSCWSYPIFETGSSFLSPLRASIFLPAV